MKRLSKEFMRRSSVTRQSNVNIKFGRQSNKENEEDFEKDIKEIEKELEREIYKGIEMKKVMREIGNIDSHKGNF